MFRLSIWLYVLWVACVRGAANDDRQQNRTIANGSAGCISCKSEQAELEEYLKSEKTARRLENIRQQLISNLHIESPPKDPQKLDALPPFLVEQLLYPQADDTNRDYANEAKMSSEEQVVLFPDEETRNCYPTIKNSLCLKFVVPNGILMKEISSAVLWLNKELFTSREGHFQNFTIVDQSSLNMKHRTKHLNIRSIQQKDGWYEIEAASIVKTWRTTKDVKHRTLIISCDTCEHVALNTKQVSNEKIKVPFIILNTENEKNSRSKRGVDCVPGNNNECCRENLEVNFNELGDYNMIYHPHKFNAYVCRGNCYYHSAITAEKPYAGLLMKLKLNNSNKYNLPTSCCTPTRFSSLSVMYASSNLTLETKLIPNMIVESCGCI